MSGFYKGCVELLGQCCGGREKSRRPNSRLSFACDSADFDDGPEKITTSTDKRTLTVTPQINNTGSDSIMSNFGLRSVWNRGRSSSSSKITTVPFSTGYTDQAGPAGASPRKLSTFSGSNDKQLMTEVNTKLFDGLMKIFSDTLESLVFVMCPVGKARRKDKETSGQSSSSGGLSGSGSSGHDEGKLYLESALLERHINETDLRRLVGMPVGLEENEWMASHTIALFEHVNLIYGTISEFCTSTSCPDMTAPCMRTYLWFDEKGKKVKVAAPNYIDYVMTFIQKTINDESIFPTKSTNAFPSSFKPIVKKIFRLMFHVIAHIYHCHFKEIVLLSIHAHLNCVFAHFTIFNESFSLVEEKETEILQDLSLAMKLRCDESMEEDSLNDSNKENIVADTESTCIITTYQPDTSDPSSSISMGSATCNLSEEFMKESALVVNAAAESQ